MNSRMHSSKSGFVDRFYVRDDDDLSNEKIRPRNYENSTNCAAFKPWGKQRSQARSLFDLVLPESRKGTQKSMKLYSSNESKKKSNNDTSSSKRGGASSFSFPPLPTSISKSIPIASNSMRRTTSELQLMEDEVVADYRDFCMYIRIVNGMNERRLWTGVSSNNCEMQNIIRTRSRPVTEGPSSYMREGLERHSINSPLVAQKVLLDGTTPMMPAPSLAINTDCYSHSRKTHRIPATIIQEPADFHDDNYITSTPSGTVALPSPLITIPQKLGNSPQVEELEGVFMMDDL